MGKLCLPTAALRMVTAALRVGKSKTILPTPLIALALSAGAALGRHTYGAPPADIDARLADLVRAYPDFIARVESGFLVMREGTRFPISAGRNKKSFNGLLAIIDAFPRQRLHLGAATGITSTPCIRISA
ncbi:MAG TPA: hypothetical protein VKX28_06250 [Xanthobacteraceae bacterium]|nr:hypothetical protein [Xanthobacteraceae bacterium]